MREEAKMLVVIANDLPPAVRGRMKLWFVEPRPNVFVSGIRDAVAKEVVDYLHKYCPPASGLMVFRRTAAAPGYEIRGVGDTTRNLAEISGLQLVIEKEAAADLNSGGVNGGNAGSGINDGGGVNGGIDGSAKNFHGSLNTTSCGQ